MAEGQVKNFKDKKSTKICYLKMHIYMCVFKQDAHAKKESEG